MTNPGAHIDATEVSAVHPNLLDNAYFVGGGSQLGDGVFPINQRGTTFYSLSYGNIFDRWHIQGSATSTCTLNSNGIAFATSTENCGLSQTIPQGRIVDGETYTLSVMDTAGNIYSGSRVLNTNASWQNFNLGLSAFGWYNPCYVAANGQTNVYILDRTGSGGSASIGLAAAKLEKGTVSTLANDVPPNFGEELAKCQRYLRYVSMKREFVYCDANYSAAAKTLTGIEMASTPTNVWLVAAGGIFDSIAQTIVTPTSVSVLSFEQNTPTIQYSAQTNTGIFLVVDSIIGLSCEI